MKYTTTLAIFIVTLSVFSQNHFLGIKGGTNWTSVNSKNFITPDQNRIGFNAGFTYDYKLKNRLDLGLEFIYSQKGFRTESIFTDLNGTPTGGSVIFKYNYDYISLPLKSGFLIGDKFSVFTNIGIVPSVLVNAKTIIPDLEGPIEASTIDIRKDVRKFDLGAIIEIGSGYWLSSKLRLFTNLGYQRSFTTISTMHYFPNSKIRHYEFNLSIGLNYEL